MVPFADLFNHKAAVVQLAGGYFVEDVCMEGAESSSDEELDDPDEASDDPDDASDGSSGADGTKACQNGVAGDSSGDGQSSGDEQATTEVKLKCSVIAGAKMIGGTGGGHWSG